MTSIFEGSLILIEDEPLDAASIMQCLECIPHNALEVIWVTSLTEARTALASDPPNVVITDLTLPDARGLEVINCLLPQDSSASHATIVQTGIADEKTAIQALEMGVQDYLTKGGITPDVLARSIRHSIVRHRVQMDLRTATQDLHKSTDDLESFAHIVAHDLRAPVRTARLFADRLLDRLESTDPEVLDFGKRLDSSLERVDRMILSMLDYAATRTAPPLTLEQVAISEVFSESTDLVQADLEAAGGRVYFDAGTDWTVVGSKEQLVRVFVNILTNSIRYRRHDVDLEITIEPEVERGRLLVRVADNGLGVEPADAERAFEILERLEPTRSLGLGFGLPMSRTIVESCGGTIRFLPEPPPGATIEIALTTVGQTHSSLGNSTTLQ